LDAFNVGHGDTGVEPRVLAVALEDAASLGTRAMLTSGDSNSVLPSERVSSGFQLAVDPGQFRVPGGGQRNRRGHGGSGLLRSRASGSHTGGAVRHLKIRNAEPGHAGHDAVMRLVADAMKLVIFFVESSRQAASAPLPGHARGGLRTSSAAMETARRPL